MVVLEYLEDIATTHADPPLSAQQRAASRLFAQMFSQWLNYIPLLRTTPGSAEEQEAVQALTRGMEAADAFLHRHGTGHGPFLAGEHFSLAEMATAPFALRFLAVLPGLRPELKPMELLKERGLSRLGAWMQAVSERPSCTQSLPPTDELVESYRKLLARMAA
ncbi:hypothetical protein AB1Y20_000126 [Prymnesium parvum]|uniref:GST C-terminal domain-containing protein n=1 Tax=Prymnesium parvum TaxID=97485 RepID=A0AB34K784_PRYPA|mmetsp:Transcript_22779/g.56632  ORF Transcript_22779/g.56632 Transcript_22779/m.56632 type:complete len:163 (+) Transcript_22779:310-798(+)